MQPDPRTGADAGPELLDVERVDLELLVAELERSDLERRRELVRLGRRQRFPVLDFVGDRWIRRTHVAIVRGVLEVESLRPAGAGGRGPAPAGPVPEGRLDVDRHPLEPLQLLDELDPVRARVSRSSARGLAASPEGRDRLGATVRASEHCSGPCGGRFAGPSGGECCARCCTAPACSCLRLGEL